MSREYTRTIVKIIFCTVVVFVFAIYTHVSQTDPIPGQIKVGATYMTMNSEFYRHLHNEIQRYSDSEGQILYTRDAEMSEEKQSKQIDDAGCRPALLIARPRPRTRPLSHAVIS